MTIDPSYFEMMSRGMVTHSTCNPEIPSSASQTAWIQILNRLCDEQATLIIWDLVDDLGLDYRLFLRYCEQSYCGDVKDKLSYLTPKERANKIGRIVALLEELSSLTAGTRFDDEVSAILSADIVAGLFKAVDEPSLAVKAIHELLFVRGISKRPLSKYLEFVRSKISTLFPEGETDCHYGYLDYIGIAEFKEFQHTPPPPVYTKHTTRQGHRMKFIKNLAFYLNLATGNPCPTLVAETTTFVFSDLEVLTADYVSKHWKA